MLLHPVKSSTDCPYYPLLWYFSLYFRCSCLCARIQMLIQQIGHFHPGQVPLHFCCVLFSCRKLNCWYIRFAKWPTAAAAKGRVPSHGYNHQWICSIFLMTCTQEGLRSTVGETKTHLWWQTNHTPRGMRSRTRTSPHTTPIHVQVPDSKTKQCLNMSGSQNDRMKPAFISVGSTGKGGVVAVSNVTN